MIKINVIDIFTTNKKNLKLQSFVALTSSVTIGNKKKIFFCNQFQLATKFINFLKATTTNFPFHFKNVRRP